MEKSIAPGRPSEIGVIKNYPTNKRMTAIIPYLTKMAAHPLLSSSLIVYSMRSRHPKYLNLSGIRWLLRQWYCIIGEGNSKKTYM